jgi:hypothetical protein
MHSINSPKGKLMPRTYIWTSQRVVGSVFLLALLVVHASAIPVTNPASFTDAMQVINYSNSPVGLLPGGTSITNQYSSLGIVHDGSTTTPPGPSGMSSPSGLPGLESDAGDPDPFLPITITFTQPFTQVGAYFLMGGPGNSITLTALRANSTVIESVTIAPAAMPLRPGPFGFNEGFVGLIVNEPISSIRFSPSTLPFVIDDLHFNVPEPSALALVGLASFTQLMTIRRASAKRKCANRHSHGRFLYFAEPQS